MQDGREVADALAKVLSELRELNEAQRAEIEQTAKLRESVDRLTQTVKGLDRTVRALLDEVAEGRDGAEALVPVVVVRKAMADGAAEDAAAHAGAATKGLLQEVLEKLKRIGYRQPAGHQSESYFQATHPPVCVDRWQTDDRASRRA